VAALVGLLKRDQFNNTLLAPNNAAVDAALGALGMTTPGLTQRLLDSTFLNRNFLASILTACIDLVS